MLPVSLSTTLTGLLQHVSSITDMKNIIYLGVVSIWEMEFSIILMRTKRLLYSLHYWSGVAGSE